VCHGCSISSFLRRGAFRALTAYFLGAEGSLGSSVFASTSSRVAIFAPRRTLGSHGAVQLCDDSGQRPYKERRVHRFGEVVFGVECGLADRREARISPKFFSTTVSITRSRPASYAWRSRASGLREMARTFPSPCLTDELVRSRNGVRAPCSTTGCDRGGADLEQAHRLRVAAVLVDPRQRPDRDNGRQTAPLASVLPFMSRAVFYYIANP